MLFQALDDKGECVGVYADGRLHLEQIPSDLTRTWKYSGSLKGKEVEYASLYVGGKSLREVCPPELEGELISCQKRFRAYLKSFKIARLAMRDHCIFELVPHDFLAKFCQVKNEITDHVLTTCVRPTNYEHLSDVAQLLHKIRYRRLNLSTTDAKHLLYNTNSRNTVQQLIKDRPYIDYQLFGTVTGRLTTATESFPILTIKKELRQILKPCNDLFVCLDYNGAEIRTFIDLMGVPQPEIDIHEWNVENIFKKDVDRSEAKTLFFAWLYNPDSNTIKAPQYDRSKLLEKWYDGEYITTPYGRRIAVDERRALNYLLQSTTADRVLHKAVQLDRFLESNNCRSYVSHILHDEIAIDYCDDERHLIPQIREIFEDGFLSNMTAGKDYYNVQEVLL